MAENQNNEIKADLRNLEAITKPEFQGSQSSKTTSENVIRVREIARAVKKDKKK